MNENDHLKYRRLPIDRLSPSAARLLLALLTIQPGEPIDVALERSGIRETTTFLAARKQLERGGFIVKRDGLEYFFLYAQEPAARLVDERYGYGATVTTKAVQ